MVDHIKDDDMEGTHIKHAYEICKHRGKKVENWTERKFVTDLNFMNNVNFVI
jgi:hypothetical protein